MIWLTLACSFISADERTQRRDQDGDGHVSVQWGGDDCDDNNAEVSPDQIETCNGVDDDCDGLIDVLESGGLSRFLDLDGDGYGNAPVQVCQGAPDVSELDGDCDDGDSAVHPGATETCEPKDEDCDGLINENDPSLDLSTASQGWPDQDGDGYGANGESQLSCDSSYPMLDSQGDCNDGDPQVNPGAEEDCETIQDENCDGKGDCELPVDWTLDGPLSGFGVGAVLDAVDLDGDGLDDLILGLPDWNRVGAVWGPAQNATTLDESFEGLSQAGMALDTAPNWRSAKPVVLVGSQGEALLMVAKVSGASLRMSGPAEEGFGQQVQLLSGASPWVAVGAGLAAGHDNAVYLFDGLNSGNVDSTSANATLKLEGKDKGKLQALEGLDHNGDGAQVLALAIERDGPKPHSVLLLEPWTGELKAKDADVELKEEKEEIASLSSGDYDGDGYADLAIGVPGASGNKGEVLVFFGPIDSAKLSTSDLSISGDSPDLELGGLLSTLSTPEEDLLVVGGTTGPVWILSADGSGNVVLGDALWTDSTEPSSVASGDVDGDGWQDLLLGYPNANSGDGQVRILSGQALLP